MYPSKAYGKVDLLDQGRLEAKRKTRRSIIIISISTVILVTIIASVAAGVVRSKDNAKGRDTSAEAQTSAAMKVVCNSTLYPETCVSSLSSYPGASKAGPKDLASIAVLVALDKVQKTYVLVSNWSAESSDPAQKLALQDCVEIMDVTIDHLNGSSSELKTFDWESPPQPSGDVQTWLSASLANLETCLDGLVDTAPNDVKGHVQSVCEDLTKLISNSLAIVKKVADLLSKLKIAVPPTRRLLSLESLSVDGSHGFPAWVSAADRRLLQEEKKPDLVVAADGSGDYTRVQDAVDAAPEKSKKRFIIKVKQGTYEENVRVRKNQWMLMLVGDGMDNTIVTGDKNFVDGTQTFQTATFAVDGMGFIAKDIQFRNTAGPEKEQAVALRVSSDKSIIIGCNISAYQDTLYAHSLRQFYRDCYISGTVDFIFGDSPVVLQNCTIAARVPGPQQKNTITAQGRTDPNENTGISIHNCHITAEVDLIAAKDSFPTYLGRPWKQYSRTVILVSNLDDIIHPEGWLEWDPSGFAESTLYYGEYNNFGPGANTSNRVHWPGYRVITSQKEAEQFTVGELIGTSWLTPAGVQFSVELNE